MVNDDEDCTITTAQVAEAYTTTFFLRNNTDFSNSLHFEEMDNLLWNMRESFKARDVFSIL